MGRFLAIPAVMSLWQGLWCEINRTRSSGTNNLRIREHYHHNMISGQRPETRRSLNIIFIWTTFTWTDTPFRSEAGTVLFLLLRGREDRLLAAWPRDRVSGWQFVRPAASRPQLQYPERILIEDLIGGWYVVFACAFLRLLLHNQHVGPVSLLPKIRFGRADRQLTELARNQMMDG